MKTFRLALITGASSGIGEALCHLLAKKGIPLIITGRNGEALKKLADRLKSHVEISYFPLDLSKESDRAILIQKIHEKSPDLIINNAGMGFYGEALAHSTEELKEILKVNAEALLEITLEGARALYSSDKKGIIMNISSVAAFYVFPYSAVYSATKAFVNHFTESFDEEMQPHGIRILAACPGQVDTHFQERASKFHYSKKTHGGMTAEFAANEIWKQIVSEQRIHIFDWKYRIATFLSRIFPKKWMANLLKSRIEQRVPENLKKIRKISS